MRKQLFDYPKEQKAFKKISEYEVAFPLKDLRNGRSFKTGGFYLDFLRVVRTEAQKFML
jgi:hypothetical protein